MVPYPRGPVMKAEPREHMEGVIRMPRNESRAGVEHAAKCRPRRFRDPSPTINGRPRLPPFRFRMNRRLQRIRLRSG